jgi:hypothetical protein
MRPWVLRRAIRCRLGLKPKRKMRTIGAIICVLATMLARQAIAQQIIARQPCPTLVVSNTGDDANGDTSSPCALIANPGSDGITLRAALFAANNATGPGTIKITFAPALAGQTISTTGGLGGVAVSRDGIAIIGLVDGDGQPTVTIDASPMGSGILMIVNASNFTLASLRFTGLQQTPNGGAAQGVAIVAGALWTGTPYYSPGNQQVSGITIRGNVFDNANSLPNDGNYLSLGMQSGSSGALISDVTIIGNTFTNFQGNSNGMLVGSGGTNNVIQNVVIDGNSFSNIAFPVEFNNVNSSNQILHTRVVGNSFVDNIQVVTFTAGSGNGSPTVTGNLIDDTLVMGNQFLNNRGPDVGLSGGYILGGDYNVSGNTVSNTQIVNNLMANDYQYGGISVTGGNGGAANNTVQGITIANNTIVNYSGVNGDGGAINVVDTTDGSPGNIVSGVTMLNTILWNNTPSDFYGLVTPSQVTTSITAQAGYAGVNGTISSNPQFVNPASNFELQSGSPALRAGTSAGAPAIDIDCQPRGVPPSIGAYEFEGPDICPTTYSTPSLLTAIPASGQMPLAVTFRASDLTLPMTYTINFGDGTMGALTQGSCLRLPRLSGQGGCFGAASHTYHSAGTYTAALLDAVGVTLGTVTISVGSTIARPFTPPPASPPVAARLPTPGRHTLDVR